MLEYLFVTLLFALVCTAVLYFMNVG